MLPKAKGNFKLWAIKNFRGESSGLLLVDSFLFVSDVTLRHDSGTALNSVTFGAAVYQTTLQNYNFACCFVWV
jgi:hypothetical protein